MPTGNVASTRPGEPEYLNLAHQFLDSNFLEATRQNTFTMLPMLSTDPLQDSLVSLKPPVAVDYFSYRLTSKEYHSCWKNISNNQFMKPFELSNVDNVSRIRTVQPMDDLMMFMPTTPRVRLENACWRAWYKNLKDLKELDPAKINWFKENDVTVLYGPLIQEDESSSSCKQNASSSDVDESEEDEEEDKDSLFDRRDSLCSTVSDSSVSSPTLYHFNDKPIKSILKKSTLRKSYDRSAKKRISFSKELDSVRIF